MQMFQARVRIEEAVKSWPKWKGEGSMRQVERMGSKEGVWTSKKKDEA